MALTYTQTDTSFVTSLGTCSSPAVGNGATGYFQRECVIGGPAGTTPVTITAPAAGGDFEVCTFRIDLTNASNCPAMIFTEDAWTINLNITSANSSITWTETQICFYRNGFVSGMSTNLVARNTGQSISLGTTGVKSMTIDAVPTPTEASTFADVTNLTIAIVFNTSSTMSPSLAITPSATIVTAFDTGNVISFQETGTASGPATANFPFCVSNNGTSATFRSAAPGGVAGSAVSISVPGSAAFGGIFIWDLAIPDTYYNNSGIFLIRVNVTSANANLTSAGITMCRTNSTGTLLTTANSTTLAAIGSSALQTTGVKTAAIMMQRPSDPATGDYYIISVSASNGSSMSASVSITSNQIITAPITNAILTTAKGYLAGQYPFPKPLPRMPFFQPILAR